MCERNWNMTEYEYISRNRDRNFSVSLLDRKQPNYYTDRLTHAVLKRWLTIQNTDFQTALTQTRTHFLLRRKLLRQQSPCVHACVFTFECEVNSGCHWEDQSHPARIGSHETASFHCSVTLRGSAEVWGDEAPQVGTWTCLFSTQPRGIKAQITKGTTTYCKENMFLFPMRNILWLSVESCELLRGDALLNQYSLSVNGKNADTVGLPTIEPHRRCDAEAVWMIDVLLGSFPSAHHCHSWGNIHESNRIWSNTFVWRAACAHTPTAASRYAKLNGQWVAFI